MQVRNRTREKMVIERGMAATNILSRARGLLWRAPLQAGEGLLIKPCNSVHTFMMGFPIDVVFVNKTNEVVHLISDMKPGRVSPIVKGAHSVIELPVGTIAATQTTPGDLLEIQM